MARIGTTLKERGQQILGLGRENRDKKRLLSTGGKEDSQQAPDIVDPEDELAEERRIEHLLSLEAEAATGNGKTSQPDTPDPKGSQSLPAREWISPVSTKAAGSIPAPPPKIGHAYSTEQVTLPSEPAPSQDLASTPLEPAPTQDLASTPLEPAPTQEPASAPLEATGEEIIEPSAAPEPTTSSTDEDVTQQNLDLLPLPEQDERDDAEEIGPPEGTELTPEEREDLLEREDVKKKFEELNQAIESLYDRILQDRVSINKDITDWCHNILAEAREIVLYRQVEKLAKAEWIVEQVRARLDRAEESSKQVAWPVLIMLWGILWFSFFIYMIFNPAWLLDKLNLMDEMSGSFIIQQTFLQALFFGGIGGVAAVFYHLFKYVNDRSFDTKYILSYFGKPFMGMILGSTVYLTVFVAMRVLGLSPIGLPGSDLEAVSSMLYTAVLFFLAMAVGFKENLAFNLLNRMTKAIFGHDEVEEIANPFLSEDNEEQNA